MKQLISGQKMATPASANHRLVYINDPIKNSAQGGFLHNKISTAKYNLVTFLFKFLKEQFSKYANVFFLFTGLIQVLFPNYFVLMKDAHHLRNI